MNYLKDTLIEQFPIKEKLSPFPAHNAPIEEDIEDQINLEGSVQKPFFMVCLLLSTILNTLPFLLPCLLTDFHMSNLLLSGLFSSAALFTIFVLYKKRQNSGYSMLILSTCLSIHPFIGAHFLSSNKSLLTCIYILFGVFLATLDFGQMKRLMFFTQQDVSQSGHLFSKNFLMTRSGLPVILSGLIVTLTVWATDLKVELPSEDNGKSSLTTQFPSLAWKTMLGTCLILAGSAAILHILDITFLPHSLTRSQRSKSDKINNNEKRKAQSLWEVVRIYIRNDYLILLMPIVTFLAIQDGFMVKHFVKVIDTKRFLHKIIF